VPAPPSPPGDLQRRSETLAHDLNNVLTTILGYASLLARSLDEGDPRRRDAEEIITATGQLRELVGSVERLGRAASPTHGEPPAAVSVGRGPDASAPGRGTVLVVDDERPVRHLVRMILGRAGYAVSEAATSREAEAWMAAQGGTVDLVMCDLDLPEGSGTELVERLRARQPSLKALFISGYSDPQARGKNAPDPACPFLPKPFTVEALTAVVEQILRR
jgi:CheY-like chemotaxis protein